MSLLMCMSLVVWRREKIHPTTFLVRESVVYSAVASWALVSFLFFAFVPLPPALLKGAWKSDAFEHCVVLSLIAATAVSSHT